MLTIFTLNAAMYFAVKEGVKLARFYVLIWVAYSVIAYAYVAQYSGLISHSTYPSYFLPIAAAIEGIMISIAISLRINDERNLRISTQQKLLNATHEINEKLKKRVIEKTKEIQELASASQLLTDSIAHDIRTPMSRLRFAFEILNNDEPPEEDFEKYRKVIGNSLDTLDYLVDQMLLHARYSRLPNPSNFILCDVGILIRDEVELFAIEYAGLRYIVDLDATIDIQMVYLDERAVKRSINNLLSNASKFASATVRMSAQCNDESIEISVEDDGPGINTPHLDKIFQPFYQAGNENRASTNGHGLGLAIVRQICNWHGGEIAVSTSDLGGAKFIMLLPRNIKDHSRAVSTREAGRR